jgi:hypothetical protein
VAQVNTVVHSEQPEEIRELLAPFAAVGQLAQQSAQVVPYSHVIDNVYPGPHRGVGEPHARAAVVRHITADLARGFAELLASGEAFYFQIRALGGAVADVPAEATAYAHRDANFLPGALGRSQGRHEPRVGPPASELRRPLPSFESDDRPGRLAVLDPRGSTLKLSRKTLWGS